MGSGASSQSLIGVGVQVKVLTVWFLFNCFSVIRFLQRGERVLTSIPEKTITQSGPLSAYQRNAI